MAMFGNIFGSNKAADGDQPLPAPSAAPQPITFTPFPSTATPQAAPVPVPPIPPAPMAPPAFIAPQAPPAFESPSAPMPLVPVVAAEPVVVPAPEPVAPKPLPELRLATPPQAVSLHTSLTTNAVSSPVATATPPTFSPPTFSPLPEPPHEAAQHQVAAALEKNADDERAAVEKERQDITVMRSVLDSQKLHIAQIRENMDLLEASIVSQDADVRHQEELLTAREQRINDALAALS